jgi:hypothetical protein
MFARFGDKKQTRRQNMAEIVFSWGGGGGGGGVEGKRDKMYYIWRKQWQFLWKQQ